MKICIFGSASALIDSAYIEAGERIGRILASHGHSLYYGGGTRGMMGALARGFKSAGGHITGVVPSFFKEGRYEELFPDNDVTIYTEDISERLKIMERESDAFLVFPGGAGTYEEFFKIFVSIALDRYTKPLAIMNLQGYFDPLLEMMEHSRKEYFISDKSMNNFRAFTEDQLGELEEFFETF